jgi:D-glycero-D-manno-heptose 1,7-bisphosphate phosphatase
LNCKYATNSKGCQAFISQRPKKLKVIFLDRDGVINRDRPDYVKRWGEVEFLPRSLEALRLLALHGYHTFIVTNQSAINRKITTEEAVQEIHKNMAETVLAHGGAIEAIYYCPHVPEDCCRCRKPEPGLIYRAQADYGLDLSEASMVGDSLKDIACGRRAGCGKVILVRTGQGEEAESLCQEGGIGPDYVAEDLMAAVQWLLGQGAEPKGRP